MHACNTHSGSAFGFYSSIMLGIAEKDPGADWIQLDFLFFFYPKEKEYRVDWSKVKLRSPKM